MQTPDRMISRRTIAATLLAAPSVYWSRGAVAQDQTRVRVAHTASSEWLTLFVAREERLFERGGITPELALVPVSSVVPAALQSGSVQIGGTTPTTFLQAVDNGLDLVVVAGGSVSTAGSQSAQYAVRRGSPIERPADFAGKRVGTPGLGSVLDVLFRTWLSRNGVDVRAVTWVETPFPSQVDVLRGGSVDAVITAEPMLTRIVSQNIGRAGMFANEVAPPRASMTIYAASRQYAASNPSVIASFREALVEAERRIRADGQRAREIFSRFVRLPPEVSSVMAIADQMPRMTEDQMTWWIDIMMEQRQLRSHPVAANLMLPWPNN